MTTPLPATNNLKTTNNLKNAHKCAIEHMTIAVDAKSQIFIAVECHRKCSNKHLCNRYLSFCEKELEHELKVNDLFAYMDSCRIGVGL